MWKDSEKSQAFMVLWFIAALVTTSKITAVCAFGLSLYYGVVSVYQFWKEDK